MKTLLIVVRAAVYGTGFVPLWGWVALSRRRLDPEIGGVLPAWTFALVFLCCAHLFVVFYEEPGLERRFGQSYLDYKRSVNRWLPRG